MKKILALSALSVLILTTGCSMDAAIEELSVSIEPITRLVQKSRITGLTSGSTQTGTASGNGVTYQVQTTVGNYLSDMEQTTEDHSYKVFSSVQGSLVTH